ncbi:MAG: fatty acid desaturase [Pirellulaceae bacterium]|nr:fatty acid desaturase [Pirellulaceae bacterium]
MRTTDPSLPESVSEPVVPRRARPAEMPVPNWLNLLLVVLVVAGSVWLLWLASQASAWYLVLAVGVAFSYLQLTNYALLHEATHANLNDDPRWNYVLGVVTGLFFLAPFSLIRVTHQGHHQRNRSDAEMFDLYYPDDSFFFKCWVWYGTLLGFFWPWIPLSAVAFALCPRSIGLQFFSGRPFGNANVRDLTAADVRRIRWELLLTAAVFGLLFWALHLKWTSVLVLYACFSFNWSTRQYVAHAFSKRDIVEGAWNLRHNWWMSKLLLHGEWDLNHHRHPEVSWYYLPRLSSGSEARPGYVRQYWRQWGGPRPALEPSPLGEARGDDLELAKGAG